MEAVAKAVPDGYTLGFANTGNITINPYLFKSMAFDPLTGLVPVGPVGTVPLFLVINSKVPARTLNEFIAYAKANPDKVSYAAAGAGTTPDLTGGEFARRAGLDKLVFVPFRGTAPATAAVIGGDVQLTFVSMGPHFEFVRNGTLRVLAAATAQRRPYVPDVPTFAELGFPNFEMSTWFSMFAPKGTPREIVEQLNAYTRDVQQDPEARKRLEASFIDPLMLRQSEFAALVKADAVKYERIVREAGIKLE
jgi:tripartite-type tricarboxylate transporter receptor subunit TctC